MSACAFSICITKVSGKYFSPSVRAAILLSILIFVFAAFPAAEEICELYYDGYVYELNDSVITVPEEVVSISRGVFFKDVGEDNNSAKPQSVTINGILILDYYQTIPVSGQEYVINYEINYITSIPQ